jgi:uncharacterized protein YjbI with pentapeptide repeats
MNTTAAEVAAGRSASCRKRRPSALAAIPCAMLFALPPPVPSPHHAALLAGKPVEFGPTTDSARTIRAEWVRDAVKASKPIRVKNAVVQGSLVLRDLTAEQDVDLIGCEFPGSFDCRHTTFKKGLNLARSRFHGKALFAGASTGHDLKLDEAQFLLDHDTGAAKGVDFTDMAIGGFVSAQKAVFAEGVKADFDGTQMGREARFWETSFGGRAVFQRVVIGGQAEFQGAAFHQRGTFNAAQIKGAAFFRAGLGGDGRHPGEPACGAARFEHEGNFVAAVFALPAEFDGVQFTNRDLPSAFSLARFLGRVSFRDAEFAGPASFEGCHVEGLSASFERAKFKHPDKTINFRSTVFADGVSLKHASFAGPCTFEGTRVGGLADFSGTQFQGVNFNHGAFAQDVSFENTAFHNYLEMRDAFFHSATFSGNDYHNGGGDTRADVRGCTFDRIQGDVDGLTERIHPYERRFYNQLEKYYRAAGEDELADQVYLKRRDRERALKWERGERWEWFKDWLYRFFANCGVNAYQLIVAAVAIVLLCSWVLARPQAVRYKPPAAADTTTTAAAGSAPAVVQPPWTWWDSLRMSVRLFLPVDVPLATAWEPSDARWIGIRYSDLATLVKLMGWLFVPLGIAAFTGLLRHAAP